jgi:hypothetical protein
MLHGCYADNECYCLKNVDVLHPELEGDIKMDKWMFVIGMIVQGVIIRLQFIVYAGFDSGKDTKKIRDSSKMGYPLKKGGRLLLLPLLNAVHIS